MNDAASVSPAQPALRAPASPHEVRGGVLFMLLSVICFTANILLLKYLGSVRGVDYSLAMLVRALVGTLIVFFFFNSRRPLDVKAAIVHPQLILRGFLGVVVTGALYWTIPELGAGKATLISMTYVLFAAVFAAIFLGESLSPGKVAWLILAFGGIALLTATDAAGGHVLGFGFAEIVALAGALLAGWVVGLIRHLTLRYSNSTIYFAQCFWIALTVVPLVILRSSWPGWGGLVVLVLAGAAGGFGQIAMVQGYRHLEVARGASIQMILPITAPLGGFLFFGELFTPLQLAGAALTILGAWRVVAARR